MFTKFQVLFSIAINDSESSLEVIRAKFLIFNFNNSVYVHCYLAELFIKLFSIVLDNAS